MSTANCAVQYAPSLPKTTPNGSVAGMSVGVKLPSYAMRPRVFDGLVKASWPAGPATTCCGPPPTLNGVELEASGGILTMAPPPKSATQTLPSPPTAIPRAPVNVTPGGDSLRPAVVIVMSLAPLAVQRLSFGPAT